METIIRSPKELASCSAGILLCGQLDIQLVSTTPATTNDNKTNQPGEHRLLDFNNRFRLPDEVWKCWQEKSTKVYNGYNDRSWECEMKGKNVEWVFLNMCFIGRDRYIGEYGYSCCNALVGLPGLKEDAAMSAVEKGLGNIVQCDDNLEIQYVI